jgi:hypothetical protein
VASTLRRNRYYAGRLGWGAHAGQIAQALGIAAAAPNSLAFARAVARWQRRAGFATVDGILSPEMWLILRTRLAGAAGQPPEPVPPTMPDTPSVPVGEPGMPPSSSPDGQAGPAAMAPPDAPDGGMPPEGGEPDGAGGGDAGEWGWSRGW